MAINDFSQRSELQQLIQGFQVTQGIHVAARLGIAELLKDGPRKSEELAQITKTNASALYRLLRLLSKVGIVTEEESQRFALTSMGKYLRSDVPGSLKQTVLCYGDAVMWQIWGDLLHSVETGEPAYQHVFGATNWEYRAHHPEAARLFDNFMTEWTSSVAPTVAEAYDFSTGGTLVDIGGGHGQMLISILQAYPDLRGVLFDLPHVIRGAPQLLEKSGVAERCEVVSGDAFVGGLPEGHEIYLLSRVIHDWDDEKALALLKQCAQVMKPQSRLLLVERVIVSDGKLPLLVLESDMQMLVATGGKERTADEYQALLQAAGFEITSVIPVLAPYSVIEASRV